LLTQGTARALLQSSYPSTALTTNGTWTATAMIVSSSTGSQPTLTAYAICSL
jgi:hypothetical protein